MFDSNHAVIIIDVPNRLKVTTDGGSTWIDVPERAYRNTQRWDVWSVNDVQQIGPTSIVAVMKDTVEQVFLRTDDGGRTWFSRLNPVSFVRRMTPLAVTFIDSLNGWGSAIRRDAPKKSVVARTWDGGRSWTTLVDSSIGYIGTGFLRLSFADSLNGLAPADFEVFRTIDGGVSWTIDSVNISKPLNRVIYHRKHPGMLVARVDHIYRYRPKVTAGIDSDHVTVSARLQSIFPNPVVSGRWLHVSVPAGNAAAVHTELISLSGAVVHAAIVDGTRQPNTISIDVGDLANGAYVLRYSGAGEVESRLVLIAR